MSNRPSHQGRVYDGCEIGMTRQGLQKALSIGRRIHTWQRQLPGEGAPIEPDSWRICNNVCINKLRGLNDPVGPESDRIQRDSLKFPAFELAIYKAFINQRIRASLWPPATKELSATDGLIC